MSPQSSIAHYRIVSKLGEGGMSAVYRTTETKLNRGVAAVLPDSFAVDPDRLACFAREAQVLASLNHPNIATICGVEERALILELVEGPTLADRIAQGLVPLDEALLIGRQIAEALEAVHENGIIRRKLKPADIMVTPDGVVKVLDFVLAAVFPGFPGRGGPQELAHVDDERDTSGRDHWDGGLHEAGAGAALRWMSLHFARNVKRRICFESRVSDS